MTGSTVGKKTYPHRHIIFPSDEAEVLPPSGESVEELLSRQVALLADIRELSLRPKWIEGPGLYLSTRREDDLLSFVTRPLSNVIVPQNDETELLQVLNENGFIGLGEFSFSDPDIELHIRVDDFEMVRSPNFLMDHGKTDASTPFWCSIWNPLTSTYEIVWNPVPPYRYRSNIHLWAYNPTATDGNIKEMLLDRWVYPARV